MSEIHADWDREKATAHLAFLRVELGNQQAVYDAFSNAADEALQDVDRRREQIGYCERMFAKPKPRGQEPPEEDGPQ